MTFKVLSSSKILRSLKDSLKFEAEGRNSTREREEGCVCVCPWQMPGAEIKD